MHCFCIGCKPEQQMMYAGSKNNLVHTAEFTKVFVILIINTHIHVLVWTQTYFFWEGVVSGR